MPNTFEVTVNDAETIDRTLEISSRPIFASGTVAGYHGIARDVTHRNQVQQALDAARHSAEEANHAKSAFLASVSHEIRSPMNGILGFLGLLRKTGLNSTQSEYMDTINQSATSLVRIIDDLLDIARIEVGHLDFKPRAIELAPLIEQIVKLHRIAAADRT